MKITTINKFQTFALLHEYQILSSHFDERLDRNLLFDVKPMENTKYFKTTTWVRIPNIGSHGIGFQLLTVQSHIAD